MVEPTTGGAAGTSPVQMSSNDRVLALRAAINLFDSTEPSRKLETTLKNQGVDYRAIVDRTGPICLRRIAIDEQSWSFEFDEELGEPGFVMAVHAADGESVIDLVGWPVRRPEAWGTYFGFAGLLGGDAAVNPASFVEAPCPIWSTPLALMQSGLNGCVVLNPRLAAPILAEAPGPFQCEDEDQARWLIDSGAVALSELMVPARGAAA
jgi:hypothetical protein